MFALAILLHLAFLSNTSAQSPRYSIANGEYANFILDNSTQTLYGNGSGGTGIGSNNNVPGYPVVCQFPTAGTKIAFVAAGLHTASCIDVSGNVYFTGPNEDGTMGNGTTTGTAYSFVKIATDANGNPFTGITSLRMGSSNFTGGAGYGAIIYAIKSDGTLWVWGNTSGGYAGNGTYGQAQTRPTQVTGFPAGTKIVKVVTSVITIALDANGGVWTWAGNGTPALLGNSSQTDYETPHQITLPAKATDIAGGGFFSYALLSTGSLYGWGWYTGYLGLGSIASAGGGVSPPSQPISLDASLNLPARIAHLSTNNTTTYVILTDGSLWAWGGNECGQVGIGSELDYAKYTVNPAPYGGTPSPYAWDQDMSTGQFQVHKPVNIAPGMNNFVGLSEGVCAVWYKYAVDGNGQLYSWGRNKSGVLANGVVIGNWVNGMIDATYPNSLDVSYITAINPFAAPQTTIQTTSPLCLTTPTASYCSVYSIPANTKPSALIAGVKNGSVNITASTASLDGSSSTDNVHISYYVWSQVSGPSASTITIPSGKKVTISGLKTGTYVFQLRVTDNGWMSDSTKYTVNVNTGTTTLHPVDSAGPAQTITLPTSGVTLTGTASETGGNISSTKWTQISGPSNATFANASAPSTTASSLVQGTYVFQLTATDASGATATSTVHITVNAAATVGTPTVSIGANQTITLPTNSVTLTATASETNGTITSYTWVQISGPSNSSIMSKGTALTAVENLVQGTYTFRITVTGNTGLTAWVYDTVFVKAATSATPTVSAGANQTITLPTNSVTLTATASETNGTITSYTWVQISGPGNSSIMSKTTASTVVENLVQGTYTFRITVTGNTGLTAWVYDSVTVKATSAAASATPAVSVGANQTITLPTNSVTLTATASETNGTIASYVWVQISGPSNSSIMSKTTASTAVDNLVQGSYTFRITVTSNTGMTAWVFDTVTVKAAATAAIAQAASTATAESLVSGDSSSAERAGFGIYPNPVTSAFTLTVGNKLMGMVNAQLIDVAGVIRHQYQFAKDVQTTQYYVSAADLTPGLYFLRVQLGTWTGTLKLIKR